MNIIFDIDGTLVESNEFDSALYMRAVEEILGRVHMHDDWNMYKDVTDSGILRQIILDNNIALTEETIDKVRSRFSELVSNHLAKSPCMPVTGAIEAIDSISENCENAYGLATGGWLHTANMKLQSASIDVTGIPFYSADSHHERTKIMKKCCQSMTKDQEKVVYVGDGPWDMEAAWKLGWGFVGIGERLRGKTEIWISDFCDPLWKEAPEKALRRINR